MRDVAKYDVRDSPVRRRPRLDSPGILTLDGRPNPPMDPKSPLITPPSSRGPGEPAGHPGRIELPWATVAKAILVLVAAGYIAQLTGMLLPVLIVFLEALLLTAALTPPVRWCMVRGLPRGGAVAVVLGGLTLIVIGVVALLGPPLVAEGQALAKALPGYVQDFQRVLTRFPSINRQLQQGANTGSTDPAALVPIFLTASGGVLSGVTDAISVVVLAAYLLAGGERSLVYAMHFLPLRFQNRIRGAVPGVVRVVSGYVFGQAATSLLFGIFTLITLEIAGVPQPVLIAVLAAILDAIPLVGTLIATAIAVLLALSVSVTVAIVILILFLAYNVVESNVILPRVYGRAMGISSLSVLVAVLIGYRLLGLGGVLIALPVAAAIPEAERAWRREEISSGMNGSGQIISRPP